MTPELERDALGDHLDRLYRAAWALCGSREDAEDLVQETYVRVLAKKRVIGSEADTLPYLLTVLRNTYVSSLRKRGRRPRTAPLEDSEERLAAPAAVTPLAVLEAREVFSATRRCRTTSATCSPRSTSRASATRRPPARSTCRSARS